MQEVYRKRVKEFLDTEEETQDNRDLLKIKEQLAEKCETCEDWSDE